MDMDIWTMFSRP